MVTERQRVAIDLLPVVNDPNDLQALLGYIEYRINALQRELETSSDDRLIARAQGAIIELRRFALIRDTVLQDSK